MHATVRRGRGLGYEVSTMKSSPGSLDISALLGGHTLTVQVSPCEIPCAENAARLIASIVSG
jgi:hypothetical protein